MFKLYASSSFFLPPLLSVNLVDRRETCLKGQERERSHRSCGSETVTKQGLSCCSVAVSCEGWWARGESFIRKSQRREERERETGDGKKEENAMMWTHQTERGERIYVCVCPWTNHNMKNGISLCIEFINIYKVFWSIRKSRRYLMLLFLQCRQSR